MRGRHRTVSARGSNRRWARDKSRAIRVPLKDLETRRPAPRPTWSKRGPRALPRKLTEPGVNRADQRAGGVVAIEFPDHDACQACRLDVGHLLPDCCRVVVCPER